jgi:hypothetical protein
MKHIEEARVRDAKITFENAGLSPKAGAAWKRPRFTGSYNRDVAAATKYWRDGAAFISKLPKKPHRNQAQQIAAAIISRSTSIKFIDASPKIFPNINAWMSSVTTLQSSFPA